MNLVADAAGQAATTDPNLVNAWGLARSSTGPWWVADNHAGVSTVYNGAGQPFPVGSPLLVAVPPPPGSAADAVSAPTGLVFNGTSDFVVTEGAASGPALFIFATEDGTISGWNQTVDMDHAIIEVDRSSTNAIYKGLALASNGGANLLYATDFHNNRIDVFDRNFARVQLGSFSDPSIPAGFAPFGINVVDGMLYVTYAKQDADAEDDAKGPGNGYIDVFDTSGALVKRFASQGALNSPWAVVPAASGFGNLGNVLLVGNFGDGHINIFDAATGAARGQITDGESPITIEGLWALGFGNDNNAGAATTLYFTAGPNDEENGLFGMLQPM